MRLVIVESSNKVPKLQGFSDELYGPGAVRVMATNGSWRGMPPMTDRSLNDAVDTSTWREHFVVHDELTASRLRSALRTATEVYLATDADREGEGIAWHLIDEFRLKGARRVAFKEITKNAFKVALENPGAIDTALVDAQRCRQVLDYAIGMEVSRRLWRFGCASAGRVQSAALRILVDREAAIDAFKQEAFWTVSATYRDGIVAHVATFESPTAEDLDESGESDAAPRLTPKRFASKAEAEAMVAEGLRAAHTIEALEVKPTKSRPRAPFSTAELQAEASRTLKWRPDKTAEVAQRLFEGGHITYLRTDSVSLSDEAVADIRAYLAKHHPTLLPAKPQLYADASDAQGAHEAIRPVHMVSAEADALTGDDGALYKLIWQRTLACQAADAEISTSVITIRPEGAAWRLIARGNVVLTPGWLSLKQQAHDEEALPTVARGQQLQLAKLEAKAGKTTPPARFTAATLTTYLKRRGIGRPSTYDKVVPALMERSYVKEANRRLVPDDLGVLCDRLTRRCFDRLTQEAFTATTEKALDKIAKGKLQREVFLTSFYGGFVELLNASVAHLADYAQRHPELDRESAIPHDAPCRACGRQMVRRRGKHGAYAQCLSEACGAKLNLEPLKTLKEKCPVCAGVVVEQPFMDGAKRRHFYRCTNDDWKSSWKPPRPTKTPCHVDAAHGVLLEVERQNKTTKEKFTRFVCSACDYSSSTEEASPPCPACGGRMALHKSKKTDEHFWGCSSFAAAGCRGSLPYTQPTKKKRGGAAKQ